MENLLYLTETDVEECLDWDTLVPAIKQTFSDVSKQDGSVVQPARTIMSIPKKSGFLLTMPGYNDRMQVLGCKLVTAFLENTPRYNLPSIMATITMFDANTGKLSAIIEGQTITEWRTAAATIVATQVLKPSLRKKVLAVLGAGRQARGHIVAFQHFYTFETVRLWNRTRARAEALAEELKSKYSIHVEVCGDVTQAADDADVVVTATYASQPILELCNVKPDVFIGAVGAGATHHSELDPEIYRHSVIFTDSMANARIELKGLEEQGFKILGEVGQVVNLEVSVPSNKIIVFQSLGMAVEDTVAGKLVLEKFQNKINK